MFYLIETQKTVNYANDTTRYTAGGTVFDVTDSIENCATILFKWIDDNFVKASSDKSHLLFSTEAPLVVNSNGGIISNSKTENLLGVTIDYQLHFDEHVSRLC